ncbi:MAG TPA: single-stranded DNA-binding protein [Candidatus Angelobacter sp.]|jgi:single-stranded DNA-binding protein|nr:single-stranded DNA-binding protein [Candidatus Angelobacter sp.]
MNTVHLVGKVASPIRLQEFPASGGGSPHAKASFLIAVRRTVGRRTEAKRQSDLIRIETWGTQARNLVKFNDKGSRIAVTGRIRGEFYNPDGGDRGGDLRTVVVAEEIVYLTPPATDETTAASKGAAKAR